MIKLKVLVEFIDIHTGAVHKVGDVIEVTEDRFEEIKSATTLEFVEVVKEKASKKTTPKKKGTDK